MHHNRHTPSIAAALRLRGWHISSNAEARARELGIGPAELLMAALQPERTWPARKPGATNRWCDGVSVLVPENDPEFIIGVHRGPARQIQHTAGGTGRAKSGGAGRRMPSSTREFLTQLQTKGFVVEQTANGHLKITLPSQPDFVEYAASTNSDHRGMTNSIARIRRRTGIDITT